MHAVRRATGQKLRGESESSELAMQGLLGGPSWSLPVPVGDSQLLQPSLNLALESQPEVGPTAAVSPPTMKSQDHI